MSNNAELCKCGHRRDCHGHPAFSPVHCYPQFMVPPSDDKCDCAEFVPAEQQEAE